MVGYPGHADVAAAKRVARGRPIVFNPLVSLEDTMIGDRALASPRGVMATALRLVDRAAFRGSDLVVADTAAHAAFFARAFELPPERLAVCFVGADDRLFTPGPRSNDDFTVLFVGKLIPLHGLDDDSRCRSSPARDHVPRGGERTARRHACHTTGEHPHGQLGRIRRLPELYRASGCALGVFGTSDKAMRVIPNKAFQALATQTPLITADTPAARELLVDGKDALLVPPGDSAALAAAVRRLASDDMLRAEIAARGRATYVQHAAEEVLGQRWRELLQQLLD